MYTRFFSILAGAVLIAAGLTLPAQAQALRASVVSAGGRTMSNAEVQVRSTLGQPVVGAASSTAHLYGAGFWTLQAGAPTGVPVEDDAGPAAAGVPDRFRLEGNYPNPFNPQTTLRYGLPEPAHVRLTVYDVVGRQVQVVVDARQAAGWHTASFAAAALPSGTYFYRIEAGDYRAVRSMLLVK